ncbi:hypothetical protein BsWGS_10052 [Bradybaena similaris]
MFSKKLSKADYSSVGNIFTFCCGFFIRSNGVRRNSEDISQENPDEKSAINGTTNVIAPEQKAETEEAPGENAKRKKSRKKAKTKIGESGSAYQYEEETSSDSDDEVLKHYQTTLVRANSVRSIKSSRKGGKARSEVSTRTAGASPHESDIASAAETGGLTGPLIYNEETDDKKVSPQREPHGATMAGDGGKERGESLIFENQAFMADAGDSVGGSNRAQSADRLTSDASADRVTSDEHLFDVSDLQHEPSVISKCGSLEVSFRYDNAHSRLLVSVHQAKEIPAKDRGGANNTQVRIMLLPGKKQRHKTRVKDGENPVFDEQFCFNKILPDELQGMGLRFRLYGLERMRRERMIGESIIGFASLNLEQETTHWIVLEPRSNLSHGDSGFDVSSLSRSDSGSSTQSLQHGGMPELLLGLAYNGTTGRLSVEVIKGSNFRNMAMNRAPDTYVKLSLMNSSGQEVQRCKTSIRRGQPNPLFKETFMLQVALFQLPEVTLMVSVYNKKSMKKKEMIGWFSLGLNSSGEEESSHWQDMRESKGEQVCRWHVLLES